MLDKSATYFTFRSGPGNPFSATVGFGWLKAITDIFSAGPSSPAPGGNFTPPPLVMSFTVRTKFDQNSQTSETISIARQQFTTYPLSTWCMELFKWAWCIPSPHNTCTEGKTFVSLFTCGQFQRVYRAWTAFMLETIFIIRQTWSWQGCIATWEHYWLKAIRSIKSEFKPCLFCHQPERGID